MRKDHRPYSLKVLQGKLEARWVKHFIAPQLERLGHHSMIMKPWFLKIHGKEISFGQSVHVITAADRNVRLTTWAMNDHQGRIDIQDYVLICPGVRIDSALSVEIGASTMLAAGVYITDADWHDIYDRTQAIGRSAPVKLAANVWVGDGATICKGVQIGENSIIGAGSVVTSDIPANVIAAGNPARVVKELDPSQKLTRREGMLADGPKLAMQMDGLERWIRADNTWLKWLQTLIAPTNKD
jgi:acetyltransferase-like isoleucine patch superfamily enzyme